MVRVTNTANYKPHVAPIGEKRVTLPNLTWQQYQQILQALPETRAAQLTYDRGTLEIVMPLEDHCLLYSKSTKSRRS